MTTPPTAYLVGIKGMALTSLAQVLVDAGWQVLGSDVGEDFPTQPQLDRLNLHIDTLDATLPKQLDLLVYTAAHQGINQKQVRAALERGIRVLSHAQALAEWFNQQEGIAVCGVGGKSTISAMIIWILEHCGQQPSFAVGVGDIIGLNRSGAWRPDAKYFVAEADEYAQNPTEMKQGSDLIPRFHYLQPKVIVASNIVFDHPDVYKNLDHTRAVFTTFFKQLPSDGVLISSEANRVFIEGCQLSIPVHYFGEQTKSFAHVVSEISIELGVSVVTIQLGSATAQLRLTVPGRYNVINALAALSVAQQCGIPLDQACRSLSTFQSTTRRFQKMGEEKGVTYFDDYAHHPRELAAVIDTLRVWFPTKRVIMVFQPHTYSRTKQLFTEFVQVLSQALDLYLLDIFASARESDDSSISSDMLAGAINEHRSTDKRVGNLHSLSNAAEWFRTNLRTGDLLITVGAGDVYQLHTLLGVTK